MGFCSNSSLADGFLPRTYGGESMGVMSRRSYTEGVTAEAVTVRFWLLLHVKVRLYHPGSHEHDEDASSSGSSNCLYRGSLLLVTGRMQDPAVPHPWQWLVGETTSVLPTLATAPRGDGLLA